MRPLAVLATCLMLLLALPPATYAAGGEGAASAWEIVATLDTATLQPKKPFEAFDTASLTLYDFDGDGVLEIVANNDNNRAYVIDPRPPGRILAEIETYHFNNASWPVRELNPISIGELYGDGRPCMVIPNSAAYMSAWCYDDAESSPTSFVFDKMWEVRVDAALYEPDFHETHPWIKGDDNKDNDYPGLDGHAYLADVDGQPGMEVFVETDGYPGQFAFNHDGTYRWSRSFADGNAGARVIDIDKDGRKDAVFVSDAGLISAFDASSGAVKWVFDARKSGSTPGSIPVMGLIADLHGDGKFETVFGTRNVQMDQSDPQWINQSHAMYFAINHKGEVLWNVSYDWMNPLQYNHPAPADVNGDGVVDIVFLDWNTIGHKPGNWNTTNRPSNLFVLDGRDGSPIWRRSVSVYWSNKDFVIADVGQGGQSIIAPTAKGATDGLGVYALADGKSQGWFPLEWQLSRGPVAGNVYGDGKLYLVVPLTKRITDRPNYRPLDVGLRDGKLLVIATREDYDVTFSANILNSEDQKEKQVQGSVGTTPTPVVTAPPPVTTAPTPQPLPDEDVTPVNETPPAPPVNETPPTSVPPNATTTTTTRRPTPSPTESVDEVPGPEVALLVAAVAAIAVLARRRR